jgi:uncharacterized protein YbjT (DUF2867 family)
VSCPLIYLYLLWSFAIHFCVAVTNPCNAILLGASGLVGGFCLQALLADSDFSRITLLNRRGLAIAPDPRLTQKTVSFENLTATDFAGADDIFCALGTTIGKAGSQEAFRRVDFGYPLAAAQRALQAGAKQFVLVSSVGADATTKNFYLRTKGELEQEICKLGFTAIHIFRPSLLLGKREEFRFGERIVATLMPVFGFAMAGGLKRYRAISAENVGKAMVAAAKQSKSGISIYEYHQIMQLAAGGG